MRSRIGVRVRYHWKFLRSVGVFSGELCFVQGEITGIKRRYSGGGVIVTVTWDDGSKSPCLLDNLEEVRS